MSRPTLLQVWKNRSQIIEGIRNSIFKKADIEEVADHRMAICNACPELDPVGTRCAAKGTQPCCSNCGCSLRFKTRSMSASCPLIYWEAVMTQTEEDLLRSTL